MLSLINILFIVALILHFWFVSKVLGGLKEKSIEAISHKSPRVSILIAARNEAENIERLLDSIGQNNYPKDAFEIVVVDDHSSDKTQAIASSWSKEHLSFQLKLIKAKGEGKKQAIAEGLRHCESDIVLQTDADCVVLEDWIRNMVLPFEDPTISLVAGPVALRPAQGVFQKLQAMEFSSLIASSIGLSRKGWSIMANAANLAYRKSAREALTFEERSASGDDVFFIQQLANSNPKTIYYTSDASTLVSTYPKNTFKSLLQQRVRWASKTSEYPNMQGKLIAGHVLILNALSVMAIFNTVGFGHWWMFSLGFLIMRFLLDFSVLQSYCATVLKRQVNFLHVALLSLVYPFYIIIVALGVLFLPKQWKGRKIN